MEKNSTKIVRLGGDSNYVKPPKTLQERLTPKQIEEKLIGYRIINLNNETLEPKTHVRYFTISGKDKLFRLGGFVKQIDAEKKYIILTNNTHSWSVNLSKSIIYKKIDYSDYLDVVKENNLLKKYVKVYKEKNTSLKNTIAVYNSKKSSK